MADLPPGFELESRGNYDPLAPLIGKGISVTNGYRTQGDIQRLKQEGYTPASNSDHLRGDAVDLVPGKSGWNLNRLAVEARKAFGPEAQIGIHNGTHVHVSLKGWGQAPGTPGTPRSGLPAVPDGFQLEQRGAINNAAIASPPDQAADPSIKSEGAFGDQAPSYPKGAMGFHDAVYQAMKSRQIANSDDLNKFATDYNAAHGTDFSINVNDPQTQAALDASAKGTAFGVAVPRLSQHQQARLQQLVADTTGKRGAAAVLGAEDSATLGASDELSALGDATGDFLGGNGFDYTGNLNANRDYISAIQGEHPNYFLAGQLGGALLLPTVGDMSSVANLAKTGAVEGGAYGFNSSNGTLADRAASGAVGAGVGAVAAPAIGTALNAAGAGVRRVLGRNVPEDATGAESNVVPEAVPEPSAVEAPQSAAMAADTGPSIVSRPVDRINVADQPPVAPGTPEQRALAEQVKPEDITEAPPLSDVAKAGNINLSKIQTPEDIDSLMKFTADTFGDFNTERRGVQSWKATEALANDLGMTPDELLTRGTGSAMNAEQAHAARGILAASAAETRGLADRALTGSAEDKATFVKAFLLHAAITEKAAGAAAESGRALNIYRKVANASLGDRRAMQDAVRRMQSGATVEDVAAMVNSLSHDPQALNRFARDAIKPSLKDRLMFVWINSLLSGPKTHIVNMTSNLMTAAMSLPEEAMASGLGAVRKGLGGKGDALLTSEIGPRAYGMIRGGAEGLAAAKRGLTEEVGGKVESARPAIGGKAGHIISIPTRLLNAEDEFFKAMIRRSELAGLAVRKARGEGLTGDALNQRIDQLMANPTDQMMSAAADAALYKTFQRPLGPAMQGVSNAIQKVPVLKLFIPFIRTPTNLLKYAVERSPAAPLLKEVRQDFLAGGAKRDLAIARMTLGTGIGTLVASLAAKGHITGNGPADPSAKRALQANGWQPYSFKIGDSYISYRRLDPWATVIGTAADAVELQSAMTDKQSQDAGAIVIGAMTQNLASKTWLSGLSDLIDAITDPKANAKNVLTRLGASIATPTVLSQVAQATDPVLRDTSDPSYMGQLRKKIEARVPGLSTNVIPRRDILGQEVRDQGGPIDRLISPFDVSTARHDPTAEAILESGARFSNPSHDLKGARLPDDMYDTYQSYSGQLSRQYIDQVRTAPGWPNMDKATKAKMIERAKNKARSDARSALFVN